MFSHIMIPVDLTHAAALRTALQAGADLARHYDAKVTYVGVTAAAPSAVAHTPKEYEDKLKAFAEAEGAAHGHDVRWKVILSHDPTTDVDDALLHAVDEIGADLVVMASHVPGLADYVWPSNGGKIAAHSKASVLVVRA